MVMAQTARSTCLCANSAISQPPAAQQPKAVDEPRTLMSSMLLSGVVLEGCWSDKVGRLCECRLKGSQSVRGQ